MNFCLTGETIRHHLSDLREFDPANMAWTDLTASASGVLPSTREGAAAKPSVGASSGSVAEGGQSRRVCKSLLTPGGSGRR